MQKAYLKLALVTLLIAAVIVGTVMADQPTETTTSRGSGVTASLTVPSRYFTNHDYSSCIYYSPHDLLGHAI